MPMAWLVLPKPIVFTRALMQKGVRRDDLQPLALPLEHRGGDQILVEIGPMNSHRHDLIVRPLCSGRFLQARVPSDKPAGFFAEAVALFAGVSRNRPGRGRRHDHSRRQVGVRHLRGARRVRARANPRTHDRKPGSARSRYSRRHQKVFEAVDWPRNLATVGECHNQIGRREFHRLSARSHPAGRLARSSPHSGKLSCRRAGISIFLLRSMARARAMRRRVECGRITSSM